MSPHYSSTLLSFQLSPLYHLLFCGDFSLDHYIRFQCSPLCSRLAFDHLDPFRALLMSNLSHPLLSPDFLARSQGGYLREGDCRHLRSP